jgi:hypothetical protein
MASLINTPASQDPAPDRPRISLLNGATPPFAPPPTPADAWDANSKAYGDWAAQQRADGVAKGTIDPDTGWPTKAGLVDAAHQLADSIMMGTTAPGMKGPGFTAYHGSPHSFDEFQSSAIGSGEGNQAYGHGLYFADREGIAKSYRDNLTEPDLPHPGSATGKPTYDLWDKYADKNGSLVIDGTTWFGPRDFVQNLHQGNTTLEGAPPDLAAALDSHLRKGSMYEVNVNADPAHFLDWDKPRDQLAPNVQAFAQQNTPQAWENAADGSSLYHGMAKELGSYANASAAMAQAGIPGIRYLDGGSRADGVGTSNHVIFDPASIEIMRKYGIAAVMGGAAAAASAQPAEAKASQ